MIARQSSVHGFGKFAVGNW